MTFHNTVAADPPRRTPGVVMPLAIGFEYISAMKTIFSYHVEFWVTCASGTPTLGFGVAAELGRSPA